MEFAQLIPFVIIGLLFWLLLIRPASKRQKEVSRMQASLGPGDQVMLGSGIFATVVAVDDDSARIHVELAPGTVVQVARGAIAQVVEPAEPGDGTVSGEVLDDDHGTSRPDGTPGAGDEGPHGDR